ncbi:Uncharacterised protein [uncultured archaeon]|nr:Uncharacterised protein [uncultured archaeon]
MLPGKKEPEIEELKAAAYKLAEARYGDENIRAIAAKLKPVADKIMGKPIPLGHYGYFSDPLNKRI